MPKPRSYLIPLFSLLVAAMGGLLWLQYQETATWRLRATEDEADLARRVAERNDLVKQSQLAADQTKVLQAELDKAAANPGARKAAGAKRALNAADAGQVSADQVKQWIIDANDPAVMRRLNIQARAQTLQRYAELFKELHLTAEQSEALTKLLSDKRQVVTDVAVTSLQHGFDPSTDPEAFQGLVVAARADLEKQIQSQLGDDAYAQYQGYDRSIGQNNTITHLQQALSNSENALTDDQVAQLQQVMQDSGRGNISVKLINDSKGFLSPAQVQALQDLRAIQLADSQKRNQAIQVLPTSGLPPAPAAK
jgi:hypothetical protein